MFRRQNGGASPASHISPAIGKPPAVGAILKRRLLAAAKAKAAGMSPRSYGRTI
jgi:hypothetical protein